MRKVVFALVTGSLVVCAGGCKPGTYYPFGAPPQAPQTNGKATLVYTSQSSTNVKQQPVTHNKKEVVVPS